MASRRARRIWISAGIAVALWAAAAIVVLIRARGHALEGRAIVDDVRLRSTDVHAIADGSAGGELVRARTEFARARAGTGAWWLAPARMIPVVGRQIRSAHALAVAAETIADAAVDAIGETTAALDLPHDGGRGRLELIGRLRGVVADVSARVATIELGPSEGLLASLGEARRDLETEVAELGRTLRTVGGVADAVTALLRGPRRTLVLAGNNAEMRAGSGTFLSFAILRTREGELALGEMRTVQRAMPEPGAVRIGGDFRDRWGWLTPADDWRTLMLSPRFDEQASVAARMWRATGGRPVRGVIAIDPLGLRAVLRATGPVRVGGRTLDAEEVADELLFRQYVRFADRPREVRRDALGEIARAAFAALDRGGWDPLVLLDELADAARGRHLMLWSADPDEQSAWAAADIAGSVEGGSMMVSVINRGGTKMDRFLRTSATLTLEPGPRGTTGTLRVTMRNRVPGDAPPYVLGPNPGHGQRRGQYVGILAVTIPGTAGSGSIRGGSRVVAVGADGPTRVLAAEFSLGMDRRRTIVVRFRLAPEHGTLLVEPSARVPATAWRYRGETWTDAGPRVVGW